MSRNIPPVRSWRVRYWGAEGVLLGEAIVQTINKRFARWLARDVLGYRSGLIRVTVSLVRSKPWLSR